MRTVQELNLTSIPAHGDLYFQKFMYVWYPYLSFFIRWLFLTKEIFGLFFTDWSNKHKVIIIVLGVMKASERNSEEVRVFWFVFDDDVDHFQGYTQRGNLRIMKQFWNHVSWMFLKQLWGSSKLGKHSQGILDKIWKHCQVLSRFCFNSFKVAPVLTVWSLHWTGWNDLSLKSEKIKSCTLWIGMSLESCKCKERTFLSHSQLEGLKSSRQHCDHLLVTWDVSINTLN